MIKNHKIILDNIDSLVADFLYYDRKEDEDLPRGVIETSIASGVVTIEEIVERFDLKLRAGL
jgi:hypothetical protein